MNITDGFYTMKGYQRNDNITLTSAMEDYLEMICRISQKDTKVRVGDLSQKLHVRPSSVTKMIQQLNMAGYIQSEKYGVISITEKGLKAGNYLLYRHNVIQSFLCLLNNSDDELEEAEKIEHYLSPQTVTNLDRLTKRLLNSQHEI